MRMREPYGIEKGKQTVMNMHNIALQKPIKYQCCDLCTSVRKIDNFDLFHFFKILF